MTSNRNQSFFISNAIEKSDFRYIVGNETDYLCESLDLFENGVVFGQYAFAKKIDSRNYEAVRDPLGIHKLFYCRDRAGKLFFSRHFVDLLEYQTKIYSIPSGLKVRISPDGIEKIRTLGFERMNKDISQDEFQVNVEMRINHVFEGLKEKEREGWKICIALSGGLDSTIIARKAAESLDNPLACTLDLGKSEDSEKASKIAAYLGIRHKIFQVGREEIFDALEEAPLSCQDFRDFNVHCATLNILLARNIRYLVNNDSSIDQDRVIILTGDLMNEFTCDYAGEIIDGKEYYKLPRVGKKQLQQYLISGLDTSDREISPFSSYGLVCIQPYAVLFDLYSGLEESVFDNPDPKKFLNAFIVDDEILSFIPKVKLRAQVGSRENMGILGLCHSMGWDDRTFQKRLLKKSGYPNAEIPIFVGRYDVEKING